MIGILPRGNTLNEADWQRRHRLLQWVLLAHVPVLAAIGLALGNPPVPLASALALPVVCAALGRLLRHHRRLGSAAVTAGLVWCSTILVGITGGTIEAHFHFFIIIGFIALYQDWVPFLLNVLFTVVSHGVGSMWLRSLMFNHPAAQADPWLWSLVHGVAVLLACIGVMLFWRVTEDEQNEKDDLTRKLADAEIGRRRFTSDMLVNLARRNQSMLYRQLEIINQLEESERNPDALAELFRLDHLTTRVRRNAENLLVLSGEKPPRVWSQPVPLRDVVRAAIAETEDLDRVAFEIPEGPLVDGASVTDVTHLLAELTENAVRFSPPDTAVTIRGRRDPRGGRGQLITVEDWGVGMDEADLAAANTLLAEPPEVDLSVSKRLGFHVVSRLAARHGIRVALSPTPGSGITASVALPGTLFELKPEPVGAVAPAAAGAARLAPARPLGHRGLERPHHGLHPDGPDRGTADARTLVPAPRPPLPEERTDRVPPEVAVRAPRSWSGWWEDPAVPDAVRTGAVVEPPTPARMPRPAPTPAARVEPVGPAVRDPERDAEDGAAARPRLRRRVPQAHLAPGLRIIPNPAPPEPASPAVAGEALSRYQASRAAARAVVDGGDFGDSRDHTGDLDQQASR